MTMDPEAQAIKERMMREILEKQQDQPQANAAPAAADAPSEPVALSGAEVQAFLQRHPRAVIDLWAPWCGPCRMLGPMLDELAADLQGQVAIGKVNVDQDPQVAQAMGVQGIPTMVIFQDGRAVDRIVGVQPKAALRQRFLGA